MGIIRFLLALAVVIVHSSPIFGIELVPGYLAVQSFYIFSGFLMTLVFNEKYLQTEKPFYYFISNRILRLYPLYFLVILLVAFLSLLFGFFLGDWGKLQYYFNYYQASPQSFGGLFLIFLTNITLIGQDVISFFGINKGDGSLYFLGLHKYLTIQEFLFVPIAWTVAVEFTFYLVGPIFFQRKTWIILIGIILTLLFRALIYFYVESGTTFYIYRFAPTEFFWFLLGVLAYKLDKQKLLLGSSFGLFFFCVFVSSLFVYQFLPVGLRDILIYAQVFLFSPAIFYRFSKNKMDKFFGDLCYPMYLGHALLLIIVSANSFPKPFGSGLPLIILTFLFSIIMNKFFLKPFERYRQSRVKVKN